MRSRERAALAPGRGNRKPGDIGEAVEPVDLGCGGAGNAAGKRGRDRAGKQNSGV
ncbi:MAG: hypothetical protein ACPL5F_13155 [Moorellaceae bacterium]